MESADPLDFSEESGKSSGGTGKPIRKILVTTGSFHKKKKSPKSEDTSKLRRSKRARMRPLEFWKGERVEWGPNDFPEDYDGVKNMSVPVGVYHQSIQGKEWRRLSYVPIVKTKNSDSSDDENDYSDDEEYNDMAKAQSSKDDLSFHGSEQSDAEDGHCLNIKSQNWGKKCNYDSSDEESPEFDKGHDRADDASKLNASMSHCT